MAPVLFSFWLWLKSVTQASNYTLAIDLAAYFHLVGTDNVRNLRITVFADCVIN